MQKTEDKFIFTEEQQEMICEHYGVNRSDLEFWEVCELLDRAIDDICLMDC